ncbi:MAG: adenylate/guanylate cyclase domain-containing protein [Actinomycetota bacterium]
MPDSPTPPTPEASDLRSGPEVLGGGVPRHDDDTAPGLEMWGVSTHADGDITPDDLDLGNDGIVAAQLFPDTAVAPPSGGRLRPHAVLVDRAFGFADLCGFSRFTARRGPNAAFEELSAFRELMRAVAASRGVRIARWLGDGAFLVGVGPGPLVAALAEVGLCHGSTTLVRAAVAAGPALLFEGDDYLGDAPNRASRLCNLAEEGQLLVSPEIVAHLPGWLEAHPVGQLDLKGMGTLDGVCDVHISDEIRQRFV